MQPEQDRGVSTCSSTQNELHLFGSYGTPSAPSSVARTVQTVWSVKADRPRLWLVSGRGWSRQRFSAGGALSPLPRTQVSARVGSWAPRPLAKLGVAVGDMAAASEPLLIDGDQSIEVYGASITVGAVVPVSVQDAGAPQRPLEVPAGELAVDDLLGCRIVGIQESRGSRSALLTDYLTVGPNDDAALPIPRGAEDVLVSPAVAGTVSAWRFTIGDPSVLASTAPVASFSPTDTSVRVPTASHLTVASDGTTRFFSITWKVRA